MSLLRRKKKVPLVPEPAIRKIIQEEMNKAFDRVLLHVQRTADTYELGQARQQNATLQGRNDDLLQANALLRQEVKCLQQVLHGGAQEALRKALVGAVAEVRKQIGAQE